MMHRQEVLALLAVLVILVGLPGGALAYQRFWRAAAPDGVTVFDLVARAPEAGGWSPEILTVIKGDTVRLRLTSPDVVHGFAIAGLGIDVGHIVPGEVTTVEFVADRVGRFTYYCNVWCSPTHSRMRGTLEVVGQASPGELLTSGAAPLSEHEELDIDAAHPAAVVPTGTPSAARGRALALGIGIELPAGSTLRARSPSDQFRVLREEESLDDLSDDDLWDAIAYLWSATTTPERLQMGEALYAKNCVGCHGEAGDGHGPGSNSLEHAATDFTAAETMAGGTSQIYFAKIRRGGMGTGMPYWGTIFTEGETWSIVDYLWTFLFDGDR
jgi:cytochrome c oxidase subunit 2